MKSYRTPKFYVGLAVFATVLLFLIFAAGAIQTRLGLYGLFVTELVLLVLSLLPVFIFKYDIYEIFPLRRPAFKQIIGILMLWIGALQFGSLIIYVQMYFFPYDMNEVVWALNDFFSGASLSATLICAAVMPAICEEALCRGLIQKSFSGIRYKWVVILISGLLFGLLHLDYYRFAPTTILGIVMAYIMAETGNLLLPILFHFVNNAWSTLSTWLVSPLAEEISPETVAVGSTFYIGWALLMCAIVSWLALFGTRLIKDNARRSVQSSGHLSTKNYIIAGILSCICVVGGIVLLIPQMAGLFGS